MDKILKIEVTEAMGKCSFEYKKGDIFLVEGYSTPPQFCGGAYTTLWPIIVALNADAQFPFSKEPNSMAGLACPDRGKVHFKVSVVIQ